MNRRWQDKNETRSDTKFQNGNTTGAKSKRADVPHCSNVLAVVTKETNHARHLLEKHTSAASEAISFPQTIKDC